MDVVCNRPRTVRGLTLVELITTTAVIGISLAIAVPTWSGLAKRNQITSTTNQMLTHLRYARSEAVNLHTSVSLCPSEDGTTCSGDTRGWQRGYLVFRDDNGNRSREGNEPLLRVQGTAPSNLRLFSTPGRPAVRFRADGAAWSSNTTFSICAAQDASVNRAVILYGTGRARSDRVLPSSGAITCI